MAIHPTLSEVNFKKSIKKFLKEGLPSINWFFEDLTEIPKDANGASLMDWVVVSFDVRILGVASSCFVLLHIHTLRDDEGFVQSSILDSIIDFMMDEESTNGRKLIVLYDTTDPDDWINVGGIIPYHVRSLGIRPGIYQSKVRSVSFNMKWGTK